MKKYICYLLVIGGLTSCSSLNVLSFEQLSPAQISYPEEVQNVAVVNTFSDTGKSKSGMVTLGELSASGKTTAELLAESLADSKYFNQVMIADSIVRPTKGDEGFSREEIQSLAEDLDADMIFALDRVSLQTRKLEVAYPGVPMTWPVIRLTVVPVVSIYIPSRDKPIQVLTASDSLDLDIESLSSDEQLKDEGAKMAASALSRVLVPHWGKVERLLYTGGCAEMRDAEVYIKEGDWEGACEQWRLLYQRSKSKKLIFRAAFNSALAYEMLGDTSEALKWIGHAKENVVVGSEEEQILKLYESQLLARIKELMYLNGQMNRFENKF